MCKSFRLFLNLVHLYIICCFSLHLTTFSFSYLRYMQKASNIFYCKQITIWYFTAFSFRDSRYGVHENGNIEGNWAGGSRVGIYGSRAMSHSFLKRCIYLSKLPERKLSHKLCTFIFTVKTSGNWIMKRLHCVKSVRVRSFSRPYFPAFGLNTERYGVYSIWFGIFSESYQKENAKAVTSTKKSTNFITMQTSLV